MKKLLLLSLFSFIVFSLSAQITYKSFGDGWAIPMNANEEVDVDEDGLTDFFINSHQDELGFTAIFGVGCFTSPHESAYTSFNSRELTLHNEGELIQLNGGNLFDYIDEDRGSGYSLVGGIANGWVDQEDVLIGFAILNNNEVKNGWLRAAIDISTQELIIKEWAFTATQSIGDGGIYAGLNLGADGTTSIEKLETIDAISISPNPANDRFQLSFDYTGNERLSIVIQNSIGKELYRNNLNNTIGNTNLNISTQDWANGIYFIRFETKEAIHTERLSVAK